MLAKVAPRPPDEELVHWRLQLGRADVGDLPRGTVVLVEVLVEKVFKLFGPREKQNACNIGRGAPECVITIRLLQLATARALQLLGRGARARMRM